MSDNKPIRFVKGVGEKRAQLFAKLGVTDVDTLIYYFPRHYQDWSKIVSIKSAPFDTPCCIRATVTGPATVIPSRSGMTIYKIPVSDGQSMLTVTIFNSRYTAARLKPNQEYLFYGKISGNMFTREMLSPDFQKADKKSARIRPIYRQTKGLTSRIIESAVQNALLEKKEFPDPIPLKLRQKYKLLELKDALYNIHFPQSFEMLEQARRRLVFEELLILQLGLQLLKGQAFVPNHTKIRKDYTDEFTSLLPFTLTDAQRRCIGEAVSDMAGSKPMSRLLQGDVGSGKTAVAAAVCYTAIKNGYQVAVMVPTEILAEQHYALFCKLLKDTGIKVKLLTGSVKASEKKLIKSSLAKGETDLVVGTHALLTSDVEFKSLGLVVTDEQHRFGVAQRAALSSKGNHPHILVMSATPIPRTLALIIYGDLDISIIDEYPPGRQSIKTYIIGGDKRERAYNFIKKHIDSGRQAFIVCPLVDESDESELKSATQYSKQLQKGVFSSYSVGLLHGQMKTGEKERVMKAFLEKKISLLIATTVIETGIDVPNACIMLVENAERFGLSQLHQLRGRVGRGKHQSYCILVTDIKSKDSLERLKAMKSTTDGFVIAEKDLQLRGPGDFFGKRQHGLPELKIANIVTDMNVLKAAQQEAREIIANDPQLSLDAHKELFRAVSNLFERANLRNL